MMLGLTGREAYKNHSEPIAADDVLGDYKLSRRRLLLLGVAGSAAVTDLTAKQTGQTALQIATQTGISAQATQAVDRIKAIISRNDEMHKAFRSDELRYRTEHFSEGN